MEEFREYLNQELRHLDYAPVAFITAKDSRNIQVVIDLAQHLAKQANERVTTGRLNRAVKQILEERMPSNRKGRRIKVFYATQIEVAPPTIALIVNDPDLVDESYQRFMVNRLRELLPYDEVPIKLLIRARGEGAARRGEKDEVLLDSQAVQRERPSTHHRPRARPRGAGARSRPRRRAK